MKNALGPNHGRGSIMKNRTDIRDIRDFYKPIPNTENI